MECRDFHPILERLLLGDRGRRFRLRQRHLRQCWTIGGSLAGHRTKRDAIHRLGGRHPRRLGDIRQALRPLARWAAIQTLEVSKTLYDSHTGAIVSVDTADRQTFGPKRPSQSEDRRVCTTPEPEQLRGPLSPYSTRMGQYPQGRPQRVRNSSLVSMYPRVSSMWLSHLGATAIAWPTTREG